MLVGTNWRSLSHRLFKTTPLLANLGEKYARRCFGVLPKPFPQGKEGGTKIDVVVP